jgi:hypothetical protein
MLIKVWSGRVGNATSENDSQSGFEVREATFYSLSFDLYEIVVYCFCQRSHLSLETMKEFKPKRKLFQIGIAPHDALICLGVSPHGLISIGAIPHGLISIGLVPMGIISIGLVSMGLLSTGIMSMGLVSFGTHNMTMLQMNTNDNSQPKEPDAEGHMHHEHMSH